MRFQFKIETDGGKAFQCVVDDIHYTKMQDAIDIMHIAFDKVIEAYKVHGEDAEQ